jgi:CRP/FNR family transcriptional regulator, cyclic AMP receptor protein
MEGGGVPSEAMAETRSNGRRRAEPSARRLTLAHAAPDLGAALPRDRQFVLEQISVPVINVGGAPTSVSALLERYGAHAAVVVEGLVLHDLAIAAEPGVRILGAGDVIGTPGQRTSVLERSNYRAMPSTELALLGKEFLNAAQREPMLLVGLQAATAEQTERLAAQLVICQMPRVADRVLTMLWLLAESYGRVTPAGTRLQLTLTHELLGAMVGARRPTVTLALGELAKRGAVVHQDSSWLLLEPAPVAETNGDVAQQGLELIDPETSEWAATVVDGAASESAALASFEETIALLHAQHRDHLLRVRQRMLRVARASERSNEVLARTRATLGRGDTLSPEPPSSG